MDRLYDKDTQVNPAILNAIAHLPTEFLPNIIAPSFWQNLSDSDYMSIAVLLAQKSYKENDYPVGAVIIDNDTRKIVGQSHRAFDQINHPYMHGARCAIRDAGHIDFSKTTIFKSLSPCDSCSARIIRRGFNRIVIGDVTNAQSNEHELANNGIIVDILEDQMGINLYKKFKEELEQTEGQDKAV